MYQECTEFEMAPPQKRSGSRYNKWHKDHFESENQPADCHRVYKLDCINHVSKRMGTHLRKKQKTKGKLADGKCVGGSPGRLTENAIKHLQKHYTNAIRANTAKTGSEEARVKSMQNAILAVLYHSTKLPNKKLRHKYCPKGPHSWCRYQREKKWEKYDDQPHHLDPVCLDFLLPTFKAQSTYPLLLRCLPGYNNNLCESINSIQWCRLPKHKWAGAVRVELGAISAIVSFNRGAKGRTLLMDEAGLPGGRHTEVHMEKVDKTRIYYANRANEKTRKIHRQKVKAAKQRIEDQQKQQEGVSYMAGGFNDEFVHSVPKPARATRKRKVTSDQGDKTSVAIVPKRQRLTRNNVTITHRQICPKKPKRKKNT